VDEMVMAPVTIDVIAALLTIPVAQKIIDQSEEGQFGEREFRRVVDTYFRLRKVFEGVYYGGARP
jgi:hypothetical protein